MNRIKRDRPILVLLAIVLAGCLMSFSAFASLPDVDGEPDQSSESTPEESADDPDPDEQPSDTDADIDVADPEDQQDGDPDAATEDAELPSAISSSIGSGSLPSTGRSLQTMIASGVTGLCLLAVGVIIFRKKGDN